jgi:hypothetical protein
LRVAAEQRQSFTTEDREFTEEHLSLRGLRSWSFFL